MRIAVIAAAVAFASSSAFASPSCMTQAEARQKFSDAHLYWHGAGHCWDATPSRRQLAMRAKSREQAASEPAREPSPETKVPAPRKPLSWAHEHRWREAMSKMLPEDAPLVPPARASASVELFYPPAATPPLNWRERWVEVAPSAAPAANKAGPAELAANAERVEPMVTPTRVMLAFLAVLLMLAVIEVLFRTTIREGRK
jgi:hypothetical protein